MSNIASAMEEGIVPVTAAVAPISMDGEHADGVTPNTTAAAMADIDPETDAMVEAFKLIQAGSVDDSTERKALVRCNQYDFHPTTDKHIRIYSYNCFEWAFLKQSSGLPVQARGLFVREHPTVSGSWRIVIRGYDKFFNVGEVPDTMWENIIENTIGPYEVTLKENGCIIFISAVEGHVIVTSKHSLGPSKDPKRGRPSHADMGERWLDTHLQRSGRSRQELVDYLAKHNVTAVFELADDDFEEHILEYPPERRGLYLHGINENTPRFSTWESARVAAFGEQFGFFGVETLVMSNVTDVRMFSDECRETGSYKGRPIEGLVVRCKKTIRNDGNQDCHQTFLFKIKYDEPYLMFREWREVTMAILAGRLHNRPPRYKLTSKYILWVMKRRIEAPHLFSQYIQLKGIIRIRNMFLREEEGLDSICGRHITDLAKKINMDDESYSKLGKDGTVVYRIIASSDICEMVDSSGDDVRAHTTPELTGLEGAEKVLLIPIASIGVGKTTLARTLTFLFPSEIGHVQNDDIRSKKSAREFSAKIMEMFKTKNVVFADRNNHLSQHREVLSFAFKGVFPSGKIVALDWGIDNCNHKKLIDLTINRIYARGDNHQTLTPKGTPRFVGIIHGFVKRRDSLDLASPSDSMVDTVLPMSVVGPVVLNVKTIIDKLGWKMPTTSELDTASKAALEYKVENPYICDPPVSVPNTASNQPETEIQSKMEDSLETGLISQMKNLDVSAKITPKTKNPSYFAIKISNDLEPILSELFSSVGADISLFWNTLVTSGRVAGSRKRQWHVTLAFKGTGEIYNQYLELWKTQTQQPPGESVTAACPPPLAVDDTNLPRSDQSSAICIGQEEQIYLKEVVWDGDIMAIAVERLSPNIPVANKFAHITVATADDSIKSVLSNTLLQIAMCPPVPPNIHVLQIPSTIVLTGTLQGMH
ncbi:hypothetical protein BASA60_000922 [Batrachochytrium salamandrivorans]|nr:hypothetical protein BASA60_000922 [Batrachochytrium salamandrivorans]